MTAAVACRVVEHILQTNFSNYIKGPNITEVGQDLLGDGIFNTNGPSWKLQRYWSFAGCLSV